MRQSDVVIVGGGVVGHTLALGLLKETTLSVSLIDAFAVSDQSQDSHSGSGFDARIIALARKTADAMRAYGIDLDAAGASAIKHIQVTDQGRVGLCQLSAEDYQLSAFGEVVSIARLGHKLHHACRNVSRFHYFAPEKVSQISMTTDNADIVSDSGQHWQSKLVVLADGGRSGLESTLGYQRQSHDYRQTAIVCNVHFSHELSGRAYERFTRSGPLAVLPYDSTIDGKSKTGFGGSVVWTVDSERADALLAMPEGGFINALQDAFGFRQGRVERVSPRVSYPLSLSFTGKVAGHRSAVVGNAAQTLHPIAGQGFNLGLRDCLALIARLKTASDPGSITAAYTRDRRTDRERIIGLTDSLVHLFSNNDPLLTIVRNAGLLSLTRIPGAGAHFVRQTTGYGDNSIQVNGNANATS